jgi:hypothetical protein
VAFSSDILRPKSRGATARRNAAIFKNLNL